MTPPEVLDIFFLSGQTRANHVHPREMVHVCTFHQSTHAGCIHDTTNFFHFPLFFPAEITKRFHYF